jgi:curved DNA-binding protein CbpA
MKTAAITVKKVKDSLLVFNLKFGSTYSEVTREYKKRALLVHPDRNLEKIEWANEEFKKIGQAYDYLKSFFEMGNYLVDLYLKRDGPFQQRKKTLERKLTKVQERILKKFRQTKKAGELI